MMDDLKNAFGQLWRHSPVMAVALTACAVLFSVEQGMNAINGYRRAGGDLQLTAIGYAVIMLAIGVCAAWCPWAALRAQRGKALGLWLLMLPMFLICQSNGWAVMGVTLADGQVKRNTAATGREVLEAELKLKRQEREMIGVTRAMGAIDAELNLEMRRTSKQFPDGDGPAAMRLKAEKATAEKAASLDKQIAALPAAIGNAPQVAGGAVDTAVVMAVGDRVRSWWRAEALSEAERLTGADVNFGFSILLVFVIGFFATFGPALILGRGAESEPIAEFEFDPSVLPPHYRTKAIEAAPEHAPYHGPFPAVQSASGFVSQAPVPLQPAAVQLPGGGATNNIYVGAAAPVQHLPPRIAARRAMAR